MIENNFIKLIQLLNFVIVFKNSNLNFNKDLECDFYKFFSVTV